MANASNYLENALLNHILRGTTYTAPSAVYVGLCTGAGPSEEGNANELAGNNYSRVQVFFGVATTGTATNTGVVTFPTPSADWGLVTSYGLHDASTNGNLLVYGSGINKTINADDEVTIPSGYFSITCM